MNNVESHDTPKTDPPNLQTVIMAFLRRGDVTQAFRNNRQLQQFVLPGVTTTGKLLGTGSFGSVEEVSHST